MFALPSGIIASPYFFGTQLGTCLPPLFFIPRASYPFQQGPLFFFLFLLLRPSGILFSPGVVVPAAIQPATHHPQITGSIVHRVPVLVVDVFPIALSDLARGHCFSPSCISVCTRLFRFCRALVLFVLHLVIAAKGHQPIVICLAFCKEGAKLKK